MNKNFTIKMGIVFSAILLPTYASATSQTISTDESGYTANVGESFEVLLNYTTDDANLTGLGVALVFDSNKLAFEGFSSSLTKDLLAADTESKVDSNDIDKESKTDRIVTIAWASLDGNWPGQTSTPLTVARFKVLETAVSNAVINITGSSASNSTFSAEPINVTVGKVGTQPVSNTQGGGGGLAWYFLPFFLLLRGFKSKKLSLYKK